MSIEFRCTGCEKLLRTADHTGGLPAKCPECGVLQTIPDYVGVAWHHGFYDELLPADCLSGFTRGTDAGNPLDEIG